MSQTSSLRRKRLNSTDKIETKPTPMPGGESFTRCVCNKNNTDALMIQCDSCKVWQHCKCLGLTRARIPDVYHCEKCRPQRSSSITTLSRQRSSLDDVSRSPLKSMRNSINSGDEKKPRKRLTMNSLEAELASGEPGSLVAIFNEENEVAPDEDDTKNTRKKAKNIIENDSTENSTDVVSESEKEDETPVNDVDSNERPSRKNSRTIISRKRNRKEDFDVDDGVQEMEGELEEFKIKGRLTETKKKGKTVRNVDNEEKESVTGALMKDEEGEDIEDDENRTENMTDEEEDAEEEGEEEGASNGSTGKRSRDDSTKKKKSSSHSKRVARRSKRAKTVKEGKKESKELSFLDMIKRVDVMLRYIEKHEKLIGVNMTSSFNLKWRRKKNKKSKKESTLSGDEEKAEEEEDEDDNEEEEEDEDDDDEEDRGECLSDENGEEEKRNEKDLNMPVLSVSQLLTSLCATMEQLRDRAEVKQEDKSDVKAAASLFSNNDLVCDLTMKLIQFHDALKGLEEARGKLSTPTEVTVKVEGE